MTSEDEGFLLVVGEQVLVDVGLVVVVAVVVDEAIVLQNLDLATWITDWLKHHWATSSPFPYVSTAV